jgi:hypothetical protein
MFHITLTEANNNLQLCLSPSSPSNIWQGMLKRVIPLLDMTISISNVNTQWSRLLVLRVCLKIYLFTVDLPSNISPLLPSARTLLLRSQAQLRRCPCCAPGLVKTYWDLFDCWWYVLYIYIHTVHIDTYMLISIFVFIWLLVSTPLKNISQLGLLFPIYGKIKNVPNHQSVL